MKMSATTLSSLYVTLMNGSVIIQPTTVPNTAPPTLGAPTENGSSELPTPFRLAPAKTVLGLPITTLSYVFLAIGGIAPVLFIVLVIIGMKCYSWRRIKRYKRYATRLQISQDVWDAERRHYLRGHHGDLAEAAAAAAAATEAAAPYGSRNVLYQDGFSTYDDEYFQATGGLMPVSSAAHKAALSYNKQSPRFHSARVSNSNPNVYFLETPILQLHRNKPKATEKTTRNSKKSLMKRSKENKKKSRRGSKNEDTDDVHMQQGEENMLKRSSSKSLTDLQIEVSFDGGHINPGAYCESLPGIDMLDVPQPPPPPPVNMQAKGSAGLELPKSLASITSDEAEALHCFDNIYLEPLTASMMGSSSAGNIRSSSSVNVMSKDESLPTKMDSLNTSTALDTASYATSTDYDDQVQSLGLKWLGTDENKEEEEGDSIDEILDNNIKDEKLTDKTGLKTANNYERKSSAASKVNDGYCASPVLSEGMMSEDIYDTLATSRESITGQSCSSGVLSAEESKKYVINIHNNSRLDKSGEVRKKATTPPLNGYHHHSPVALDKVSGITKMETAHVVANSDLNTRDNIILKPKSNSANGPSVPAGANGKRRYMKRKSSYTPGMPSSVSSLSLSTRERMSSRSLAAASSASSSKVTELSPPLSPSLSPSLSLSSVGERRQSDEGLISRSPASWKGMSISNAAFCYETG